MGALTLAIETSNPSAGSGGRSGPGVALGRVSSPGHADLIDLELLAPGRPHDAELIPAIDRLTRRAGVRPAELGAIAVSVGPGGFTSLRIAVSTAKMIAEPNGARCIAVPSALVASIRVAHAQAFAVALAGKHDSAFATVFDRPGAMRGEGRLIRAADIASLGVKLLVADDYLPAPIREACAGAGVEVRPPEFDAEACLLASSGLPAIDPLALLPIYAREPEAVTKWRALHPARSPVKEQSGS